ncbi:MAG: DoxX family membrane protein [Candidatus Saccharibacteria bacterium]
MNIKQIDRTKAASWCLRIGLVYVFLYAALSSLQHPVEWIGFLPTFMTKTVDGHTLIHLFSAYEIALSAWLLVGKYLRYAALLAAATLAGIVVMDLSQLVITFRDVGLALMALALAFLGE